VLAVSKVKKSHPAYLEKEFEFATKFSGVTGSGGSGIVYSMAAELLPVCQ